MLSSIAVVESAGLAYRIRRDNYRNSFQPVAGFLKEKASPQSSITTNPGVAFGLGFPGNVVHDPVLGYYTGKRFDYIVIDPETAYSIERSKDRDPEIHDYLTRLLADEYSQIYDHQSYAIYSRKPILPPPSVSQDK